MPEDPERVVDEVSLVDVRCSTIVVRNEEILLLRRDATGDWVLPGGRPRPGESIASCARRETQEETGLDVTATRCALVLEVIDPYRRARIVELIFAGDLASDAGRLSSGEPGATPYWVPVEQLRKLIVRPPIAGYLRDMVRGDDRTIPYVGDLWRSDQSWVSELWEQAE